MILMASWETMLGSGRLLDFSERYMLTLGQDINHWFDQWWNRWTDMDVPCCLDRISGCEHFNG